MKKGSKYKIRNSAKIFTAVHFENEEGEKTEFSKAKYIRNQNGRCHLIKRATPITQ